VRRAAATGAGGRGRDAAGRAGHSSESESPDCLGRWPRLACLECLFPAQPRATAETARPWPGPGGVSRATLDTSYPCVPGGGPPPASASDRSSGLSPCLVAWPRRSAPDPDGCEPLLVPALAKARPVKATSSAAVATRAATLFHPWRCNQGFIDRLCAESSLIARRLEPFAAMPGSCGWGGLDRVGLATHVG
jgi:hypothetical protein